MPILLRVIKTLQLQLKNYMYLICFLLYTMMSWGIEVKLSQIYETVSHCSGIILCYLHFASLVPIFLCSLYSCVLNGPGRSAFWFRSGL